LQTERLVKLFSRVAFINGILAFIFTIPILIPQLCIATPPGTFGCNLSMETSWPGTWVFFAYIFFLVAGVLGTLGWAAMYFFADRLFGKTQVNKMTSWLHLILFEIGVLGATSLQAAIGLVGGNYVAHGGSAIIAAEVVRTNIIPPLSTDPTSVFYDMPPVAEALFIGLAVLGMLLGIINYLTAKSGPMQSGK